MLKVFLRFVMHFNEKLNEKRVQLRKHYITPFTWGVRTQVAEKALYSRHNIKYCIKPGPWTGQGRRNSWPQPKLLPRSLPTSKVKLISSFRFTMHVALTSMNFWNQHEQKFVVINDRQCLEHWPDFHNQKAAAPAALFVSIMTSPLHGISFPTLQQTAHLFLQKAASALDQGFANSG